MAVVDIFNLQQNVISKDLKGKFVCLYGGEKIGKSTFGSKLPRGLFCNFEMGTNFLNVKAQPIEKWTDFKQVVKQLEKPEAKELYDTVIIDTIGRAYTLCENYICQREGVQKLGQVAYGAAYGDVKKEFEDVLTRITLMGYGILIIAHSQKKSVDMGEFTIEKVSPNIPTRAAEIVNRLVDIIAYAHEEFDENGNSSRWLITRSTPTIAAGSRIKYLDPKIPFTYDDLVDAIGRAIEKEQQLDNIEVVETSQRAELIVLDYKEIRKEAEQLWGKLLEISPENAKIILKKAEIIFGRPIKLSEITEDQVDLYNLILIEMRDLYEECTKPLV